MSSLRTQVRLPRLIVRCALVLALAVMRHGIEAATITVTGTSDTADVDGVVTLREAIYSANANLNFNADVVASGGYGVDTINFNIPGAGVHTIRPGVLPTVTGPLIIDGYSQPGASPNTLAVGDNAVLLIELDGTSAGGSGAIEISADNCTIRGLVINRFPFSGIAFINADNNVVEGNFIGTDPSGTVALENMWHGVEVLAGAGNVIGGTLPASRNIISGNRQAGVKAQGGPGTIVRGNYIGTDPTGTTAVGNAVGVFVSYGCDDAIIGGSDADDGALDGVVAARNVISGNRVIGVNLNADVAPVDLGAVTIRGNIIGLDVSGASVLANSQYGIVDDGIRRTGATTIGGTAPGAGNIISGNGFGGIASTANGLVVQGNLIGTDIRGTMSFGNQGVGLFCSGMNGVIGGSAPGARNVIAGNSNGITIRGSGCSIQGNFIGTQIDGISPLGNAGWGIEVDNATSGMIGGMEPGEGNVVAYCEQTGIAVGNGTQISLLGNSIFSNGWLGIDLSLDGITPNDDGDSDGGGNGQQNFPMLTSINGVGANTVISGVLNSTPNTTFRIEFFGNDAIDQTKYGEGQLFAGFTNVTTDASGNATFSASVPRVTSGRSVTATATDPNGNTSEFSTSIPIGQLLNISTRLRVRTGENVLIGGFIIGGPDPKRLMIRGIGPSLGKVVPGFLSDPVLELHGPPPFISMVNDNWRVRSDGGSQQDEINATGLAPSDDLESALVLTLPANNAAFTAIVRGQGDDVGIGVVEVYDVDATANSELANISTRGFVETGNGVMIGGLVSGNGSSRVIIRGIGPSLAGVGIAGALANPTLELHNDNGAVIASNDDWRTGGQEAEIVATNIPPIDDLEAAIVGTLAPGAYTAIVAGAGGSTGVALVEIYNIQ